MKKKLKYKKVGFIFVFVVVILVIIGVVLVGLFPDIIEEDPMFFWSLMGCLGIAIFHFFSSNSWIESMVHDKGNILR